jgi:hypothetical protein
MLIIPSVRRLRLEDLKFQTSLGYFVKPCLKTTIGARCWWLTPVILATQETEIRGNQVRKPALGK